MIENLINFGALGIVGYVVYMQMNATNKVINNNTRAIQEIREIIYKCKR